MTVKSEQDPKLLWLLEQTKLYFFEGFGPWKFDDPEPDFDYEVLLATIRQLAQNWIGDAANYFNRPQKPSLQFYKRYEEPIGMIFGELLIIPSITKGVLWEFALLKSHRDVRMPVGLEMTLRFENEGRDFLERFIDSYPKILRHFLEYRVKFRLLTDDKTLASVPNTPTIFEEIKAYFSEREDVNYQFEIYYDITWKTTLQTINYAVRNMFAIYDSIVAINDSRKNSDLLLEYFLIATKKSRKRNTQSDKS